MAAILRTASPGVGVGAFGLVRGSNDIRGSQYSPRLLSGWLPYLYTGREHVMAVPGRILH